MFEYQERSTDLDMTIQKLDNLFLKTPKVFTRHLLATRQQKPGESLDKIFQGTGKAEEELQILRPHC